MKDIQFKTIQILNNRKYRTRFISFITALSMIMMVIMPCLEIMPVIAEGGEAEISAEGQQEGDLLTRADR